MPDPIVEYVRSGFLNDVALDIPPPPQLVPEIEAWVVAPSRFAESLDRVLGEPELRLTERKSVIALRKGVTVFLLAIVVLKALFGGRKNATKSKQDEKEGKSD
jgi:hypothetical protein